uniref:Uncharacterized protein n=1 Tax=Arundo donax TaxID=35708 RepID=A0A0A9HK50_ARUDO
MPYVASTLFKIRWLTSSRVISVYTKYHISIFL